jgi:hypothetical protein
MAEFQDHRVETLIAMADCRICCMEDRNHAVRALEQLRGQRALPILCKYRTGVPCDHLTTICRHGIDKGARWTENKSHMAPQLGRILLTSGRWKFSPIHS